MGILQTKKTLYYREKALECRAKGGQNTDTELLALRLGVVLGLLSSKKFEISSEIENFRARMKFSSEPPTAALFFRGIRDVEIENYERD